MKCGLGNWQDIASQFVDTKTPKDCEEHYFTFYYKSKEDRLPSGEDFIVQDSKPQAKREGRATLKINDERNDINLHRIKEFQERKREEVEAQEREFCQNAPASSADQNGAN